jgi:uncharacterized protein YbbK (DUF523 family)
MDMYIISACLLGEKVRYDGNDNLVPWVAELAKNHSYCAVCPEMLGGLSCPRLPAEILRGRVVDREGTDVTEEFEIGAHLALEKVLEKAEQLDEPIEAAILKARSPSCGKDEIYDGSFTKTLRSGDGIFAALLKEKNIKIITEEDTDDQL